MGTETSVASTSNKPFIIDMSKHEALKRTVISSQWGMVKAYTCPVCEGKGFVQSGFYDGAGNTFISSTLATEQCRSCKGKGYIIK